MARKVTQQKTSLRSPGGARPGLKRATYYLTKELIIRLKVHAARRQKDLSTVVRKALDEHLDVLR